MKKLIILLFLFTACPYGISFGQDKFFSLFDEDLEAPSAPTSLLAVGSADKITLTWTDPTALDLKWIIVYRDETTDPTTIIDTVLKGVGTYADTPLVSGTIYYYRLRAEDNSGNLSAYTSTVSDTAEYTLLAENYKDRVIADGGSVINMSAVNDTIVAMQSRGTEWTDLVSAWGYKYGIKKDANNKITKLYDIKNGLDAVQADTANSPRYYADSLYFAGSRWLVIANNALLNITDKITVYYNLRALANDGNHIIFQGAQNGVSGYFTWFPTGAAVEWNTYGASTTMLSWTHSNVLTIWAITKFQYDKDGGTNNKKIIRDGTTVAQATITGSISTFTGDKSISADGGSSFVGSIKEIRIYNGIH